MPAEPSKEPRAAILARFLQEEAIRFDQLNELLSSWRERLIADGPIHEDGLSQLRERLNAVVAALVQARGDIRQTWAAKLGLPVHQVQMGKILEECDASESALVAPAWQEAKNKARQAMENLARLEGLVHSGLTLLEELLGVLRGNRGPQLYGRDGHLRDETKGSVFELKG